MWNRRGGFAHSCRRRSSWLARGGCPACRAPSALSERRGSCGCKARSWSTRPKLCCLAGAVRAGFTVRLAFIIFGPFIPRRSVSEVCAVCVTGVVRADSGCAVSVPCGICVTAASCVRMHPLDSIQFPRKSWGPLSRGKVSARSGIPLTPGFVPISCWVTVSGLSGASGTADTDGTGGETAPPFLHSLCFLPCKTQCH